MATFSVIPELCGESDGKVKTCSNADYHIRHIVGLEQSRFARRYTREDRLPKRNLFSAVTHAGK